MNLPSCNPSASSHGQSFRLFAVKSAALTKHELEARFELLYAPAKRSLTILKV